VDRTLQLIRQLRPEGQAAAIWLINEARTAGLPAIVVETRRSRARQHALVAAGASKTLQSKHLLGRAMDVAIAGVATDAVPVEWWSWLHDLWESIGGARRIGWDLVHFEW